MDQCEIFLNIVENRNSVNDKDPDHCNRDGPDMTFRWCKGWFLDGSEMV